MKNFLYRFSGLAGVLVLCALAACQPGYRPLDASCPVVFLGDRFVYQGDTVILSEKALYVDGTLSPEAADTLDYVFTTFNDAAAHLVPGTEEAPMRVYIAPYVYWIDDPDDPEERVGRNGGAPYGLEVTCPWLHLIGLNTDPANVVLACNRGQTQGANGNFTMFHFTGDGFYAAYLTFGNYCNVDLEYPLKPALNRAKRFAAITQAQLAMMSGDRIMAEHCRFVSRLNLCPLLGGRRTFFYDCHFESTDDALTGSAVYLDCDFDFYSSKPFGAAGDQGAVLLNSTFHIKNSSVQYLTKMGGQVTIVDGRFLHPTGDVFIGWTEYPSYALRCYQSNVTLNGQPIRMHASQPWLTVDMTDKPLLGAYKLEYEGKTFYNTYNLLRGSDDWDPMHVKDLVAKASARDGRDYAAMATTMSVTPGSASIETGRNTVMMSSRSQTMNRFAAGRFGSGGGFGGFFGGNPGNGPGGFGGFGGDAGNAFAGARPPVPVPGDAAQPPVTWLLSSDPDGTKAPGRVVAAMEEVPGGIMLSGRNDGEEPSMVYVRAVMETGLEGAAAVTVVPPMLPSPRFTASPEVSAPSEGSVRVEYTLDLQGRADQSLVTWYRADGPSGEGAVPVAVSRHDQPLYTYRLQSGDVGHYLVAEVAPKHIRSLAGSSRRAVSARPMKTSDLRLDVTPDYQPEFAGKVLTEKTLQTPVTDRFHTDFTNFPDTDQRTIRPGYWTLDTYKPADITKYTWQAAATPGWVYGSGEGGAVGTGLLQRTKGARMLYTPTAGDWGDMYVRLKVDPCKSAGQGFGSATGQYMDIYIKFSPETLTGYALRIERTTKYADAVDFVLMKYENGQTEAISEPVSAGCFRTGCSIVLGMSGNQLKAHVETASNVPQHTSPDVVPVVDLAATVQPSAYGGTGIQHTGTTGASATMLHEMEVIWYRP